MITYILTTQNQYKAQSIEQSNISSHQSINIITQYPFHSFKYYNRSQHILQMTLANKEVTQGNHNKPLSKIAINHIFTLQDQNHRPLVQKYTIESILSNIEKHQIEIVELFSKYIKDGFNLLEFVRFFLNIIPHETLQNLFLAIGLIDLFRQITLQTHQPKVMLKDITNYMCDKILRNNQSLHKISAKYLPFLKFVNPNLQRKPFLQIPPTIYGETHQLTYKLCLKTIKTDSCKHSRAILKSKFCHGLKSIFILDSLSESISVYDVNCSLQKKINPLYNKFKKEVIILSFAFSQRQYRIGAVLKDFSIKFWDGNNQFQYQKSISTTSICQNLQTNIFFLEYFNAWITTDKTGSLYHWNLLQEVPQKHIKCKYSTNINDICEISSLNLIVVIQECKRNSKLIEVHEKSSIAESSVVIYHFYNGHIVTEIDLFQQRIPHTVLYSETYQVLFLCGLEKKIKIYELHPKYMDASLKGELIGHENLITCFTLIDGSPMLASADDKGKVKIWDYRNFMCIQTIDFSDKTVITNLLDMIDIGKMGIFGSRVNYIDFQDKHCIIKKRSESETIKVQSIEIDENLLEMYIFANKNLRVIDLINGQIKHIFSFTHYSEDEEYTVCRYFSSLKKFVLGNTKGQVSLFSNKSGQLQSKMRSSHEGAISFIEFDELNKLLITVAQDSKILVHRIYDGLVLKQLKNNFNGREINCMQLSVYHNLLIISSTHSTSIFIWNYQYGKLIGQITLDDETPVALHLVNGFSVLLVATNRNQLHAFKINTALPDLQISRVGSLQMEKQIVSVYSDMKLKGWQRNTFCQYCRIIVTTEGGRLLKYDITEFISKEPFKLHCKEKSNYNGYRECKENFISEKQKQKHRIFSLQSQPQLTNIHNYSWLHFKLLESLDTQFHHITISKNMKIDHNYNLVVGNQRRVKIWNRSLELLCDYNINYCLPYKWQIKPVSLSLITEKIYYGVKTIESIIKKYENDISISEIKHLEIRQLFNHIEKDSNERINHHKFKMITEPEQFSSCKALASTSNVKLLQQEYTRKDLNYELLKKFNFTEVGGPSLKELDNVKKMHNLQSEWRQKEEEELLQKNRLIKSIEAKAKKNQQKQQIQFLLIKPKKYVATHSNQTDKNTTLYKKLTSIEHPQDYNDKKLAATFNKPFYSRSNNKNQADLQEKRVFSQNKINHPSLKCNNKWEVRLNLKSSFEEYYKLKHLQQGKKEQKGKEYRFRDILTEMNGRIKGIKKQRYYNEATKPN